MKTTMTTGTWLRVLGVILVLGVSGPSFAASPPEFINFQGVLRNSDGNPQNGIFDMLFRFYDAPVGGNEVLIDEHLADVTVTQGLFDVALGSGNVVDGSGAGTFSSLGDVFRRLGEVYLEVEIGGEILSPRTRVLSAAYSIGDVPADPPCWDQANRFVDCGNGTVTDTVGGLVWLKDAACLGTAIFAAANASAAALGEGTPGGIACDLTDGSSPGDWRLPTLEEWQVIIARANALACTSPAFPDIVGTGCCGTGTCAFSGVSGQKWSSTTVADQPTRGWNVQLGPGVINTFSKSQSLGVWPVR